MCRMTTSWNCCGWNVWGQKWLNRFYLYPKEASLSFYCYHCICKLVPSADTETTLLYCPWLLVFAGRKSLPLNPHMTLSERPPTRAGRIIFCPSRNSPAHRRNQHGRALLFFTPTWADFFVTGDNYISMVLDFIFIGLHTVILTFVTITFRFAV